MDKCHTYANLTLNIGFMYIHFRSSLQEHFHELYFIPDIPELTEINTVLSKTTHKKQVFNDLVQDSWCMEFVNDYVFVLVGQLISAPSCSIWPEG